jgi:hypothetical protein
LLGILLLLLWRRILTLRGRILLRWRILPLRIRILSLWRILRGRLLLGWRRLIRILCESGSSSNTRQNRYSY